MRNFRQMERVQRVSYYWLGVSAFAFVAAIIMLLSGWISLGGDWTDDHIALTFQVNTTEIDEDVSEAAAGVATIAELETVRGIVARVDADSRSIQLNADDSGEEQMSFELAKTTRVFSGDEAAELQDIAEGDKVVVVYREDEETGRSVEKVTKLTKD